VRQVLLAVRSFASRSTTRSAETVTYPLGIDCYRSARKGPRDTGSPHWTISATAQPYGLIASLGRPAANHRWISSLRHNVKQSEPRSDTTAIPCQPRSPDDQTAISLSTWAGGPLVVERWYHGHHLQMRLIPRARARRVRRARARLGKIDWTQDVVELRHDWAPSWTTAIEDVHAI
jgi:hypothetical protein